MIPFLPLTSIHRYVTSTRLHYSDPYHLSTQRQRLNILHCICPKSQQRVSQVHLQSIYVSKALHDCIRLSGLRMGQTYRWSMDAFTRGRYVLQIRHGECFVYSVSLALLPFPLPAFSSYPPVHISRSFCFPSSFARVPRSLRSCPSSTIHDTDSHFQITAFVEPTCAALPVDLRDGLGHIPCTPYWPSRVRARLACAL